MKARTLLQHAKQDVSKANLQLKNGLSSVEQQFQLRVKKAREEIYLAHVKKRQHLINRIHSLQDQVKYLEKELERIRLENKKLQTEKEGSSEQ